MALLRHFCGGVKYAERDRSLVMSEFKWRHFEGEIILWAVRWYCRYGISYRDLEQMMGERGVSVDHSTIYRWAQKYAPEIEKRLRWQWCRPQSTSWRVDETYVKVRGKWAYLYRALDKHGNTIDFYLSPTRTHRPLAFAPIRGRGLKHRGRCYLPWRLQRSPHTGAWIETLTCAMLAKHQAPFAPTRGRGLKHAVSWSGSCPKGSPPHGASGIKDGASGGVDRFDPGG
jgi:hypothetical protein